MKISKQTLLIILLVIVTTALLIYTMKLTNSASQTPFMNFEDKSKRNENWCWWVDEITGKGQWVPVTGHGNLDNGKYTYFFCTGKNAEIGKLKNGKNYDTTFTFDLSGQLIKTETFIGDSGIVVYAKDGDYTDSYLNCSPSTKGHVKNHKRTGMWTWYHKDGKKDFTETYINDSITERVDYYESGKISHWKTYPDSGNCVLKTYYESGQLKDSGNVLNNKQIGVNKHWYSNGNLKEVDPYKTGHKHGEYRLYYENGKLQKLIIYQDGKAIKSQEWSDNGTKLN